MSIVFGGDAGIKESALSKVFHEIKKEWEEVQNRISGIVSDAFKENVYVDSGFSSVPGTVFSGSTGLHEAQKRNITSQEPSATIYIKKRAFWNLRNENSSQYLDEEEKFFLKTTKLLFEKKCAMLASYEMLSKTQRLLADDAESDLDLDKLALMVYALESGGEALKKVRSGGALDLDLIGNISITNLLDRVELDPEEARGAATQLRELYKKAKKSNTNQFTTWVVDPDNAEPVPGTGRGVGTIELAVFNEFSTNLSLDGSGNISFSMQDPYNLTKISYADIEYALQSAVFTENAEGDLGPSYYLNLANKKDAQLKKLRQHSLLENMVSTPAFGGGSRSEIIFEVNPGAGANRVVGTISSSPHISFDKNNFGLSILSLPVEDQLSPKEVSLVKDIFDALEKYVGSIHSVAEDKLKENKSKLAYARSNLRKHYLGKSIIQVMDSIHVFIKSNTMYPGTGVVGHLLNKHSFITNAANDKVQSDAIMLAEMRGFGLDPEVLPVSLYRSVRSSGMLRNAGRHAFGGLVTKVGDSFSNGVYTTNVSGESNIHWLELSRVNVKPSVDQFQAFLEDPLTPFELKTNLETGLIEEEPQLLKENLQLIDEGKLVLPNGARYNDKNAVYDRVNDGGDASEVRQHVSGLKYKWKSGPMAVTINSNLQTSLSGSKNNFAELRRYMGISVIQDPFAGQDAANIVSILVTGYPYSYQKFFDQALSVGTLSLSQHTPNYFDSLFNIHSSKNVSLGSFWPLGNVNINNEMQSYRFNKQISLKKSNKELNILERRLAQKKDRRRGLGDEKDVPPNILNLIKLLDIEINRLEGLIEEKRKERDEESVAAQDLGLRMTGNDVVYDPSQDKEISDTEDSQEKIRSIKLRDQFLTMRKQYDCKFNEDKNYFIVSDEYSKNLDLQAFAIAAMGSQKIDMWHSDFKNPLEICRNVAGVLDFEFFCDTDGHIRFRPPQYNRTPLSLMLKMFILADREDKELMPPVVTQIFDTGDRYKEKLNILGLNIRLGALILGRDLGEEVEDYTEVAGDLLAGTLPGKPPLDLVDKIIEIKNKIAGLVGGTVTDPSRPADRKLVELEILRYNDWRNDTFTLRFEKELEIRDLAAKWQRAKDMYNRVSANKILEESGMDLLDLYGDLIEDDYNDYLGPGSSKRFVINDDQIISSSFSESGDQAFSHIEVSGQPDYTGDQPGELGGVPVLRAGAADFDMWRQYGFRKGESIVKPFLKNVDTQCAPYALMLLARARKNILTGSVVLVGNEYYQLGDVVYISSRDMLYYVHNVSQKFSYSSGDFTTELSLKYGRPLGEYIPSPMDIIGKLLISNQRKTNHVRSYKENPALSSRSSGLNIGTILFGDPDSDDPKADMLGPQLQKGNLKELRSALNFAYLLDRGERYEKIEIRGFVSKDDDSSSELVKKRTAAVRDWLKAPTGPYNVEREEFDFLETHSNATGIEETNFSPWDSPVVVGIKEGESSVPEATARRWPSQNTFNHVSPDRNLEDIVEIVLVSKELAELVLSEDDEDV